MSDLQDQIKRIAEERKTRRTGNWKSHSSSTSQFRRSLVSLHVLDKTPDGKWGIVLSIYTVEARLVMFGELIPSRSRMLEITMMSLVLGIEPLQSSGYLRYRSPLQAALTSTGKHSFVDCKLQRCQSGSGSICKVRKFVTEPAIVAV